MTHIKSFLSEKFAKAVAHIKEEEVKVVEKPVKAKTKDKK
jgi:hypothetical protein|tara:strand:+ start:1014 stop:1133 length:120 start_codon:yes stop_codon:yes gene_type:complete